MSNAESPKNEIDKVETELDNSKSDNMESYNIASDNVKKDQLESNNAEANDNNDETLDKNKPLNTEAPLLEETVLSDHDAHDSRTFDIVLYGATSFVGQLTAEYLFEHLAKVAEGDSEQKTPTVRWAIAGRNQQKLEKVKRDIGADDLSIVIADSEDIESLNEMCAKTKVIISTVGPYLKYGEPLIKACVNNGTDYVDLTGEAIFIKKMMDKYQQQAKSKGARIVNSCGFDSIPSDLGVLFTQQLAADKWDEYCDTINMRVKVAKGGLSGGTIASMGTIFEAVGQDKSLQKQSANPYLLVNDDNPPRVQQTNLTKPEWDFQNERWLAPFVMASINTRIVHRSNELLDYKYGRDFKYDEAMWMPAGTKGRLMSYAMTVVVAGFAKAMMFKPSREVLYDHVLPKSGSGPSKSERENGFFDIRFIGFTNKQHQIRTKVTGERDPGYGSTCRMLAQSALCLLLDTPKANPSEAKTSESESSRYKLEGGFWTPASALGHNLIQRLEAHADIYFTEEN